jgi:hypothetical protein
MSAPEIQLKIRSRRIGLSHDHDLLIRDQATDALHYAPSGPSIRRIVKLTQAAYEAIETPDNETLYLVVG